MASLEAHTTAYDGGVVGSGVYNPEALRGRVYRTLRRSLADGWRDGYCRPADIVAHLLETPAEYRRGAAPLRGAPLYLAEV